MQFYRVNWTNGGGPVWTRIRAKSAEHAAFLFGRTDLGQHENTELISVGQPNGWHITSCGWCGGEAAHRDNCKHDS